MKKIIYSVMMLAIAVFTLSSCEDVPAPYGFPEGNGGKEVVPIGDPEGTGTVDDPYNVAAALTMIKAMADGETTEVIFVKGKISAISNIDLSYGSADYYISDDGSTNNELQVYHGKYLGGKSFTSEDQIKVGDEVIVKGKCKNFMGNTPEFDTGSSLYMLNGNYAEETPAGQPQGSGVQNDPYNVAAALALITPMADGEMTDEIYVKGKISRVKEVSTQNGNATYFISDDGTTNNELQVYRGKYLGGADFTSANQIKVGDEVIVKGKCKNFKGNTPEFDQGNVLYSLNGQTEGGGSSSGQDGITKTVEGSVVTITDNSVTITPGTVPEEIDLSQQGWEDKQATNLVVSTNMCIVSFEKGEGRNAPAYYPPVVRMYAKNLIKVGGGNMKIAKVVLNCDGSYTGNETLYGEAEGTTLTIYNEFSSNSGGTQLRVKTIEIYYGD